MENVKRVLVFLAVAAAVFAVVGMNNLKSQERYAAKFFNTPPTEPVNRTSADISAKTRAAPTNTVNQAARKASRM